MNRPEITKFLGDLLISDRLSGMGKYWAQEVCIGYGTRDVRRVDFMEFDPPNQCYLSNIEKGIFTCYEVKSCKEDFDSGFGRNFLGEKNYFVMPMETYKLVENEDLLRDVGVLVPIPIMSDESLEYENPSPLDSDRKWKLVTVKNARVIGRNKSITELLFCMLRSCNHH